MTTVIPSVQRGEENYGKVKLSMQTVRRSAVCVRVKDYNQQPAGRKLTAPSNMESNAIHFTDGWIILSFSLTTRTSTENCTHYSSSFFFFIPRSIIISHFISFAHFHCSVRSFQPIYNNFGFIFSTVNWAVYYDNRNGENLRSQMYTDQDME